MPEINVSVKLSGEEMQRLTDVLGPQYDAEHLAEVVACAGAKELSRSGIPCSPTSVTSAHFESIAFCSKE